jgi:hypothetical protein
METQTLFPAGTVSRGKLLALLILLAGMVVAATGCGSKASAGSKVRPGAPVTLRPLQSGDTFHYVVHAGVGPLESDTNTYLTVRVNRKGSNRLLVTYTETHLHRARRSRTERRLHLPPREQKIETKTAQHLFTQDASGTLRWQGPRQGEHLSHLLTSCLIPEMRVPLVPGQTYDSGEVALLDPMTGQTRTTGRVRYTVKGYETVRVPTGKFDAIRVEFEKWSDLAQASTTWTDWYTADQHLVKRESESEGIKILGRDTRFHESLERIDALPKFQEYKNY